jgi:spore germination protein YaaH
VFGYVNASNLASSLVGYPTWDFNNLSTIALFGLHIAGDGSFSNDRGWQEWNSSDLTALLNIAHPRGIKVVPSIIFHDYSSTNGGNTWTPMCSVLTPAATSHTVADITSEVKAKGADGFNMNYEGNNQMCPNGLTQAQMLVTLMQQLRASLPGYYISIATYNGSYYPGYFFDLVGLNPSVDSFFLMDYDSDQSNYQDEPLRCSVYCFSPTAPLNRYTYNDSNSIAGYLGVVPASKIILGVPYYGYTACIPGSSRPGPNAVPYTDSRAHWSVPRYLDSSTTDGYPGVSSFATNYDIYTHADSYSTWYDSDYSCWRESYWTDTYSLGAKYDLVNNNNLRGVGIFTLDYGGGAPELWQTLHNRLGGCIAAALTVAPTGPEPPGGQIRVTATSTGCTNPVYAFWLQYPDGTWVVKQAFGANTWYWDTTGAPLGTYTIHVWANQRGDPTTTWDSYGELAYSLAVVPPCNASTLSPASATQAVGTAVSFTATSGGCRTPVYQYWLQDPSGRWTMVRPFSIDPTWSWNSAGLIPGTYTVHAWANQYGDSTAIWESYGTSTITLTGCTSAAISPPTSSVAPGTTVSLTASSVGCANPLYEWWVQYPNGIWYLKQNFGGNTFSFSTAGLPLGTYYIHVWANQQGSWMQSWQAYGSATVANVVCTAATLSPKSGSAPAGTTVTFTAGSSGCPNPVYAFWLQYPDSTWHLIGPFTTASSWAWNTAGYPKGNYVIHVWANQQGSDTSSWQAYGSATYTLT